MTRLVINPGVCGFKTTIEVTKEEKRRVSIIITTDCEQVAGLGKSLKTLEIWEALKHRSESEIQHQAEKNKLHASCPVPISIIKAIEVEAGLALPRDVSINFENEQ